MMLLLSAYLQGRGVGVVWSRALEKKKTKLWYVLSPPYLGIS